MVSTFYARLGLLSEFNNTELDKTQEELSLPRKTTREALHNAVVAIANVQSNLCPADKLFLRGQ